jgi:hypothetical protein
MGQNQEETKEKDPELERLVLMVRRKCVYCGHEVFYHAGPPNENGFPDFNCRYDGCNCPNLIYPKEFPNG